MAEQALGKLSQLFEDRRQYPKAAGYWRENIVGTLADIQDMTPEERADNLIESNQLMKVRETLLDSGQHGDHVTEPTGISIYGSNGAFAWWGILSLVVLGVTFLIPERRRRW